MRLLPAFLFTVAAFAQATPQASQDAKGAVAPSKAAESQTADQAKPAAEAKPADAPAGDKAASPAPSTSEWITGSFEVGYRWMTDVRGNYNTYRSVVDLGEGPKLIGLDFTITDPKHRLFDRLDARANSWGGDPYNTAHLDVRKKGLYELTGDYRNIAYFNAMPSYANPVAPLGIDQRSFDTRKRDGYLNLQLFPGGHILPYLVYERNSTKGQGAEMWVQDSNNEFAVPEQLRDSTNNYRGGVRLEYNRWHVTIEEGGTTYKEDDQASFNGVNYGDRTTPVLGTTSLLTNLTQTYGIRGTSTYSKVLATANPFAWLDVYGQFLYSKPTTTSRYFDLANGNFAMLSSLLLYSGQFNTTTGAAGATHKLSNGGIEVRPHKRLRIIDSVTNNHYDGTGIGVMAQQILLSPGVTGPALAAALSSPEKVTFNSEQVEAIFEAARQVTVRGGYRREWGDATVRAGGLDQSGPLAFGNLERNVWLLGTTIKPVQKVSLNLDYEKANTRQDYFRTGLYDYYKLRTRARYQPFTNLWFQANFTVLNNQNPTIGVSADYQNRDNSLAVYWTPAGGKRVSVMAEYNRSSVSSRMGYLSLPFYAQSVSLYKDNANTASSTIDVVLPAIVAGFAPKLSAGGSLFVSKGSRPTSYYQPLGRLSLPVYKHVQWNTEWRWYGFGETVYQYEGFRTHLFMTGLKISK